VVHDEQDLHHLPEIVRVVVVVDLWCNALGTENDMSAIGESMIP
jgi:hypothetical protein